MEKDVEQVGVFKKKTILTTIMFVLLFSLSLIFYKENKLFMMSTFSYQVQLLFYIISLFILFVLFNKSIKKEKLFDIFSMIIFIEKVLAIVMFVNIFIISTAKVDGASMQPNYFDNDTLLIIHGFYNIDNDDVVIIDCDDLDISAELIIKRVVAKYGDKIEYKNSGLFVNDIFVENMSSYEYNNLLTDFSTNTIYDEIPEDFYIVLGDNRNNSTDSRKVGLIAKDEIIGKSILRILPLSSFGIPV